MTSNWSTFNTLLAKDRKSSSAIRSFEISFIVTLKLQIYKNTAEIDQSPAILTSDDFIRSNEIIRTKWPIYVVIGHFVLTI